MLSHLCIESLLFFLCSIFHKLVNATLYSLLKLLQGIYSLWRIMIKLKAWRKCYTFALLKAIELEGIKNHIFNMMGKLCCS